MLEHGGRLRIAATRYGIAPDHWLDLSTGINPNGWPVPSVPPGAWQRLPEDDDELVETAYRYYGARALLPVAGSQAAIGSLPLLRAPSRVAVLDPGYNEHRHAWRRAGHDVRPAGAATLADALNDTDVLVLANPNNPDGASFAPAQLLEWHARLAARGGWLVVDEAFVDTTPAMSLAPHCPRPGLIVLRSVGKFFGLAGARVGFVCAEDQVLNALRSRLGPWPVPGPSRWVATRALRDGPWQQTARARLDADRHRLGALLGRHGLTPAGGCSLFQYVRSAQAARIHDHLARRAILTRRFEQPAALRFGLPGSEPDWARLETALGQP